MVVVVVISNKNQVVFFNKTFTLVPCLTHQLMLNTSVNAQGDKDRIGQISVQKWPQRSPKIKPTMALYQKIHVMRNTIYVESFMLF